MLNYLCFLRPKRLGDTNLSSGIPLVWRLELHLEWLHWADYQIQDCCYIIFYSQHCILSRFNQFGNSNRHLHKYNLLNVGVKITEILSLKPRAFVSTRPLVQKHVKLCLGEWLLETTRPDKHVKILENIPSFFTNVNYFQPLLFIFESRFDDTSVVKLLVLCTLYAQGLDEWTLVWTSDFS